MRRGLIGLAIAALSGMGSAALSSVSSAQTVRVSRRQEQAVYSRATNQVVSFGYPNGPGWTHAKVQRMATKRRNKLRHKAAVRKAGGRK